MSFSRIQAYLGLDISGFKSGLEKANEKAETFKKTLSVGGLGGSLGIAGVVAALVQSMRAVVNHAQEARDKAHEMGTALSLSTIAVASIGDGMDGIKDRAMEIGTTIASW